MIDYRCESRWTLFHYKAMLLDRGHVEKKVLFIFILLVGKEILAWFTAINCGNRKSADYLVQDVQGRKWTDVLTV